MNPDRAPRVLVPCAEGQAAKLSGLLRARGAHPIELPFSRTLPPLDPGALQIAARQLAAYHLVVFSSAHAVEQFLACIPDRAAFQSLQVAAVGSETAEALLCREVPVSIVPEVFTGEGLLEALAKSVRTAPGRALFVRAQAGRDVVPAGIRAMGWQVDSVAAYRTEYTPAEIRTPLRNLLECRQPDAILLTASGVACTLAKALGKEGLRILQSVDLVSIGPVTTATAQKLGLKIRASATVSTFKGLVEVWAGLR